MKIRINLHTENGQVTGTFIECPFWRNSMGKMQLAPYPKHVELLQCVKCTQCDKFTTNYIYC